MLFIWIYHLALGESSCCDCMTLTFKRPWTSSVISLIGLGSTVVFGAATLGAATRREGSSPLILRQTRLMRGTRAFSSSLSSLTRLNFDQIAISLRKNANCRRNLTKFALWKNLCVAVGTVEQRWGCQQHRGDVMSRQRRPSWTSLVVLIFQTCGQLLFTCFISEKDRTFRCFSSVYFHTESA